MSKSPTKNDECRQRRDELLRRLFAGTEVPRLWCPPLTHYDQSGRVDPLRMRCHLQHLARHVRGWLMPGSTGDGWELNEQEAAEVLQIAVQAARQFGGHLLIGVLRTNVEAMRAYIERIAQQLQKDAGTDDPVAGVTAARVCGFTVCPPKGADLSQADIEQALRLLLQLGLPTALYQLPQVTENEMSPRTVRAMADEFPNFYLLKDTSGKDRIAMSDEDLGNVVLVRGAEGDYAKWLKSQGGPYDGFLLSTANCFADRFSAMIHAMDANQPGEAEAVIAPVERVVASVFALVEDLADGNPFANANKAIDHFMAFGDEADAQAAPRLHAGASLPKAILDATGRLLKEHDLLPTVGYMQQGLSVARQGAL